MNSPIVGSSVFELVIRHKMTTSVANYLKDIKRKNKHGKSNNVSTVWSAEHAHSVPFHNLSSITAPTVIEGRTNVLIENKDEMKFRLLRFEKEKKTQLQATVGTEINVDFSSRFPARGHFVARKLLVFGLTRGRTLTRAHDHTTWDVVCACAY